MLELKAVRAKKGAFELRANWSVEAGARVAILGPSGGGKSTLLDVIGGFLAPVEGRVMMGGQDVTALAPGARPMSILFQENNLFPHLSVAQNVGLGLSGSLRQTRRNRVAIDAALDEVGLAGLAERMPEALSGGQRQRAALARVLLRNKPILALDEPFAALGPALRADMLELVTSLATAHGTMVLMVTHAPQEARALGGQLVFVEEGLAHAPAPVDQALDAPTGGLRSYVGEKPG